MTATEEIKDLLEKQGKAFNDFKTQNDLRLKEIEKTGSASATTVTNVEKLNQTIDDIAEQLKTATKRADALEAAVNRINLSGGDANLANANLGEKLEVFNTLTGQALDAEGYAGYRKAVNAYLRKGDKGMKGDLLNSLSVGADASGGYWVQPDMSGPMVKKIYETSPLRQYATVLTISTDALEGPVDNDECDSGWVAEKGTRSETDAPALGKWRIPVHEQYAEPRVTQQLLDDAAVNVEAWLGMKTADKLSRTETTAFYTGNGSGKPRGFLDYTKVTTADATRAWDNIQYVATGVSGAFDTAANGGPDKLLDVVYALKTAYRTGAVWMMSRATVGTVRKLKDGQGNYLWVPGSASQPATLHGYAIAEAEDMPAVAANSYSIAFGNFGAAYIIVDRAGIKVLRDPYTAKPYVKFYTTKRVGGGLVNGEAIKLLKFA